MADDFNESDLADVNATEPAPAESPDLTPEQDANIQAAVDQFFGKAGEEIVKDEADQPTPEQVQRRQSHNRRAKQEQQAELVEDGEEPDPSLEDDAPQPEPQSEEEATPEAPAPEPVAQDQNDIDPTLRYFAETELGWSKDKIDRLVKADPEIATETISKLAESYTNLSRQFLNPASSVAPSTPAPEQQQPAQPQAPTSKLDEFFGKLNEFAEANGEELSDFIKALKDEVVDGYREMRAAYEVQQKELLRTEARTVFTDLSKRFADLYGSEDKAATEKQNEAKQRLGELADQIRTAAKLQGRELSVREALNRAHLIVSADYRDAVVRKQITEQVQKRGNAITARPTQRRNPVTSASKTRATAEDAYAKKAAELGIEIGD